MQIPDVLEDPEYKLQAEQRAGGFCTLLGVPMKRGDGALIGVARNEVRPFTAREIQLVETFRPGRHRHRERPAVQRDEGGPRATTSHRGHSLHDLDLSDDGPTSPRGGSARP